MPSKSNIILGIFMLYIFMPKFEASYISKQLRDILNPPEKKDQTIQQLNSAIYYAARNQGQGIEHGYHGVDVHEIHEIHSLTDYSDGEDNAEERHKAIQQSRRSRCKGVVCEHGGSVVIERGQCVCSCTGSYVGYNCQYRGDNCGYSHYTDCFLKPTHVDLTTGYWALKFQHHFLAARAKYSKTIRVTSEDLYLGKPYKLTFSYTQKARHRYHRFKVNNYLTVVWKGLHKHSKTLYNQNFGHYEGITGSKCVNVPQGFGQIIIKFSCCNPYHCNIVPPHDKNYIKKKNTSFFLDEVRLQPGKC
ncbi:uncharacterized protein LOC134239959 [Saccostrea cucullata]|uniref:uncharacterized protein LOC134239959 n=1 Tax=Saccostrea cuccullata TaxID=36930 RepID=UPI002ED5829E